MMAPDLRHLFPLGLLVFTACDSSPGIPPIVVRDSADIRIVESYQPRWSSDQVWQVSQEPVLSIGAVDGDPEFSFDRITGVYRVGDGTVAVLDEGADQVRFFDPEGVPRSVFGRGGQGPGEFQNLELLGIRSDSLWLYDGRQMRLTILDLSDRGFRVSPVGLANTALGAAGLLADGSVIFASDLTFTSALADSLPAGFRRFDAAYVRVGPAGDVQDTILIVPGAERLLRYGRETVEVLRPLFARSVSHTVAGRDLIYGDQETYQIAVYSQDGELQRLIRRPDADLGLDEESYNSTVERRVAAAPDPARPGLRAFYETQTRPTSRPAYSRFLMDSGGFLWVQDFAPDGDSDSWDVFDDEGAWLGTVQFPARFRPTQILRDQVAGVWQDAFDVEYARVHELVRP